VLISLLMQVRSCITSESLLENKFGAAQAVPKRRRNETSRACGGTCAPLKVSLMQAQKLALRIFPMWIIDRGSGSDCQIGRPALRQTGGSTVSHWWWQRLQIPPGRTVTNSFSKQTPC